MENLYSVVPYHDPYDDISCSDQILKFEGITSVGLQDFPSIAGPSSCGDSLDPDDPLSDPFIWEVINEPSGNVVGDFEDGPSGVNGERVGQEDVINSHMPQSSGFGNPLQVSVWPVPPSPYFCSCCQVLREIIHTNGKHVRNLEIHGRVGIICHAVLDKFDLDISSENHEYQIFDFCTESIESVKNFLVKYCADCKREGYNMLPDPLSNFYQAVCVGFNENDNPTSENFLHSSAMASGKFGMNEEDLVDIQEAESNGVQFTWNDEQEILRQSEAEKEGAESARSFLATQRERTRKLRLKDFSQYFHLPISDAAKKIKVCPTVIKKKCRQAGLSRWPYRKIKGIKRKISDKKDSLTAGTAEERARALADIQMLEQELADIFGKLCS